MFRFRLLFVVGLLIAPFSPAIAGENDLPRLAAHRAIYDITLDRSDPAGSVVAIRGRLAIEVQDSCDGFTTNQRFWTEMMNGDGEAVVSDFTLSSWEAKDGSRFRFEMRNELNGNADEEFAGDASVAGPTGGQASMTKPEAIQFDLPKGTVFPNQHLVQLILNAQQGRRFASIRVFDGSGEDGLFETGATIGHALPPETGQNPVLAPMKGLPSWPVRIAFFPLLTKAEEPQYEIAFRLFENGISTDIVLDYGDYSMKGVLRRLDLLPGGC